MLELIEAHLDHIPRLQPIGDVPADPKPQPVSFDNHDLDQIGAQRVVDLHLHEPQSRHPANGPSSLLLGTGQKLRARSVCSGSVDQPCQKHAWADRGTLVEAAGHFRGELAR